MKSLHELIAELETWLSHLRHHAESVPVVQAPAPQSPAPQVAAAPAQPATGTVNPFEEAYRHSNPQQADTSGAEGGPGVDTSAEVLDFAKVGNWKPIDMDGSCHKRIENCPANVTVHLAQHSGQNAGDFQVTINGNQFKGTATTPQDNGYPGTGPVLDVTVTQGADCHLQMIVRG